MGKYGSSGSRGGRSGSRSGSTDRRRRGRR